MAKSTRLRYVSSSNPLGLETVLNKWPFKVEIKSVTHASGKWWCWFVLPDNISHKAFEKEVEGEEIDVSSIELEEF